MSNLRETCLMANGDAYLKAALARGKKAGDRVFCMFRPEHSDLDCGKKYVIRIDDKGKPCLALDMDAPRGVDTSCIE